MLQELESMTIDEDEDTSLVVSVLEDLSISLTISEKFLETDSFVDLTKEQAKTLAKFLLKHVE